jgi:hypothetical protein
MPDGKVENWAVRRTSAIGSNWDFIMEENVARASAQLKTIEIIHDVLFTNKKKIARMIADGIQNERQVLQVCTSINLWVAGSGIKGETEIPEDLIAEILKFIEDSVKA